jgi:hypothetical protein
LFIQKAIKYLAGKPPKFGREKHLILVPAAGVGFGGGHYRAGEIIKGILDMLYKYAKATNFDFGLVSLQEIIFQAAISCRVQHFKDIAFPKDLLPEDLKQQADKLVPKITRLVCSFHLVEEWNLLLLEVHFNTIHV